MKAKVLLIDDEPEITRSLTLALKGRYEVYSAYDIESAQQILSQQKIDVIVTDLNFHGKSKSGLDLIDWLNGQGSPTPVIVLSGEMEVQRVVSVQRRILDDYLVKPVDVVELFCAIEKARQRVSEIRSPGSKSLHEVLTQDARILAGMARIKKVIESSTHLPICIYGESGTGKEELAKYAASVRGGPCVSVNMAALPQNLEEGELFGHVRGAFTGAVADKPGKFQAARGGVLFLDEIGDCPLHLQVKLLRALQEREVIRVGSNTPEKIDAKIIVATHLPLRKLVVEGKFREDLLWRIEGEVVQLPPLRDRIEDLPLLVGRFLQMVSPKARPATITAGALEALKSHAWPGNVRELKSVIERAAILANMREVDIQHLSPEVLGMGSQDSAHAVSEALENEDLNLGRVLQTAERLTFKRAIERSQGSRRKAIELLGLSEATFFRRARELDILGRKAGGQ